MTELSGLFNQRHLLLSLPNLMLPSSFFLTFLFLTNLITFSLCVFPFFLSFSFTRISLISLRILFFLSSHLAFPPSIKSTSKPVNLPLCPSLPPFYHSAVFTVIHYHFFCQLALTVLSFCEEALGEPLGDKEMTEGGLYLPLWPLPCHLLNHVANRQHCLPARPHQDNREPHSYLIQWSV